MNRVMEKNAVQADSLSIIPASDAQLPIVREIAHRVWPVAYEGILTPPQIANMLEKIYSFDNLRQEIAEGHRFWVAYVSSVPVAFVSGYRENADIIWLKKIYVDPAVKSRGIGRALIETIERHFTPARELRLLVNPYNTPAHRFYEHAGFTKIGTMPVRMGDWNFDDFIYSRPLPAVPSPLAEEG